MSTTLPQNLSDLTAESETWKCLANGVIAGKSIGETEAIRILESADDELLDLCTAASHIRRHYFGNSIQLYFLMNAKSGLCPEDCHYCSQSKISSAEIPKYNLLSRDKLMEGAKAAFERQSKTYCIVISGRAPNNREITAMEEIVPEIKKEYGLSICACLGILTPENAARLKEAGVDRVNHNLNTGEAHYEKICTTHTYADRMETLENARSAGLELCSGGILGMGEAPSDLVSMAMDLRKLQVESIPLNFLHAIDGTPLQQKEYLRPQDCLRALCMFRFVNPSSELRIAGGRERHLRSLQPLGLLIANSIFVGDYLTTKGQLPDEDYQMISDLGLEITGQPEAWNANAASPTDSDTQSCCGGGCE